MGGNFHLHLPHKKQHHNNYHNLNKQNQGSSKGGSSGTAVPKGCLAIKVGHTLEEQERFVVPVVYLKHPLFIKLLKEAEEEYGFDQKGTIVIPCHVEEFRHIKALIDQDNSHHHHHHHHRHLSRHHHRHHHHHHNLIVGCFRA